MNLIKLDKLPGQDSMLIFHVLARIGYEGLVIVSPGVPLASVGYFQDAEKEIDLDFCKKAGISVMRREVGGGATYLDGNQIFYQMIWNRKNPKFPTNIKKIFELLSQPPCETYRKFGIKTSFRAENDIVTDKGKKIAGEGGGDIGESMVFVGGILLDFDYRTMSKVLKVPDEKFRDKIYKTMEENLTTMKRELGEIPPREEIKKVLIESFEKLTGKLEPVELDNETIRKMRELEKIFMSEKFLFKKTPRIPEGVKIKEGIDILYGLYKANGGLIRTAEEVENKKILKDIVVSGDFNLFPKNSLQEVENVLKNKEFDRNTIQKVIEETYEKNKIESPGVEPEDIAKTIIEAK
ncbi:MAG TPA: lipoate--protein ligase family protein [candidate division WOR-3 bacterium]|uniref:lipoate--protein ligase n=1 Tax=candidate division WOR-3 bacterium TaxID=2052148 RepID=A0A9C9ELR7_UNCW3|nr:lipoate--protein ligase family protein [candidate division WOR-3 bacterium]